VYKRQEELTAQEDMFRSKETDGQETERHRRNEEYKKDIASREEALKRVNLNASVVEKRDQEMADGSTMAKIAANAKKIGKFPVSGVAAVGSDDYSAVEAAILNK